MKNFRLLTASGLLILVIHSASAAVTPEQAALLKTTLTPMGAERAGSADGLIPAWTGGNTTVPSSFSGGLMPDFYASDQKVVTINAGNMAQYKDRLSVGVMAMMTKYPEFHIDVYPTHRSAAAPQWVYDNNYQNALNAQPAAAGIRNGFTGAYGGIPFPIPDADPYQAGAEIVWNHICRWQGSTDSRTVASFVESHGVMTLASAYQFWEVNPLYIQGGSAATYDGYIRRFKFNFIAPPNINGQAIIEWQKTGGGDELSQVWQYLNGQGRVRKAPELTYDTPSAQTDGESNYDEYFMFNGSLTKYDWKLIGKEEIYIPYNNNKLFLSTPQDAHLPHSLNPNDVRWELHRVWVVDGTLHSGERNIIAHRRFYIDEDTWTIALTDEWDAQGNIWKEQMLFNEDRPDLPGTIYGNAVVYNLQTDEYVDLDGPWNVAPYNGPLDMTTVWPPSTFNPQALGAQSQY
jgi:hypothetical protein